MDIEYVERPGYDRLWMHLSYVGFLVMPRVLCHAMPDDWQARMSDLMDEYDSTWDFSKLNFTYTPYVSLRVGNRYVKSPEWMLNYRYPQDLTWLKYPALATHPKESSL